MTDPRDVLPVRLQEILDERPLRREHLAVSIGVAESLVAEWLEGVSFPCPRQFERLRASLGVSRDDLLT